MKVIKPQRLGTAIKRKDPGKDLFEFHYGLHLKDSLLWLDALRPRQLCFVSHAGIPGAQDHQKILTTELTAELLQVLAAAYGRGKRAHEPQALVTPYWRPFSLGLLNLELFPSGFVLGASSLLIEHEGLTIVYTGQINPRKSPLAERLEARRCDVLALPIHFGHRRFVFPPFEQVAQSIVSFARDGLARHETVIFFCSPVGEAQEVALLLMQEGIPVVAHRRIQAVSRIYTKAGMGLENLRRYQRTIHGPYALIWPLALRRSPTLSRLSPCRTAFVSGLALEEDIRQQVACDVSFPLSVHADYRGLLEYVRACDPGQVVLTHGFSPDLMEDLRALGLGVTSIGPPRQMALF